MVFEWAYVLESVIDAKFIVRRNEYFGEKNSSKKGDNSTCVCSCLHW